MTDAPAVTAGRAPLDVTALRQDFPILRQQIHGRAVVYLDNASTTQKPSAVIDRLTRFYAEENANVHRGVHQLSERATEAYEAGRATVARFLHAREAREIVFVRGTTEAVNLVAATCGRARAGRGDEIVISAMEHHSNIVPWQMLCEQTGARLRIIPITDAGELDLDAYEGLLTDRTRIVSVVHVSNVLGTVNPIEEMVRIAHRRDIPVFVDGAQAAAHLAIDVQAIGCDFYAWSGHKAYGPTGIGVLYGRADLLDAMPPYQGGGDMIQSVTFERTTYNAAPYRFEAGTPHIAGAVGLAAAIDYLTAIGFDRIAACEDDLLAYAIASLARIPGIRLIGAAAARIGVLSFVLDGVHPHDLGTVLDREGVAIRAGHHCCQPLMDRFGVPATARASLALYNTRHDIDALSAGLQTARGLFPVTSDLQALYQDVLIDHNKRPRNFRTIEGARTVEGFNPLCGDRLTIYVKVEDGAISDVGFQGFGCAIATASASLLTESVTGKTVAEAGALIERVQRLVTASADAPIDDLGALSALAGVRRFPVRVKCAMLAWHALRAATAAGDAVVTTE